MDSASEVGRVEEGPFFPREELYLEIPERTDEKSLDQLCSTCELRSTRDSCRYVQYDLLPFSLPFYKKLSTDIQNETKCNGSHLVKVNYFRFRVGRLVIE